ncbi:hypothetical protein CARUB_v10015063mg [Capsella rubella]|uniref:Uncharacterized protein n=1 Tax=Capsella rubella TaxID=81985 RepID=R0I617_9BRAS|nr:uncharacterized protein LOC17892837 [Capsella rubella]EOA31838.1 hypothetical protein CARUB_v10015063mg [Capsella rubella]
MEKISIKCDFLIFLAVISVMMSSVTIQNVEAKRLLHEAIPETKLHHDEVSTQVITPQIFQCREGCTLKCVPNIFIVECFCLC